MKRYFIFDVLVWLSCEVAYQDETFWVLSCGKIFILVYWEFICFVCQHNCLVLMLQKWF